MSKITETEWVIAPDTGAKLHEIDSGYGSTVHVAALIAGDGVDLVVTSPGGKPRTIQLTCAAARDLCLALVAAAFESALALNTHLSKGISQ